MTEVRNAGSRRRSAVLMAGNVSRDPRDAGLFAGSTEATPDKSLLSEPDLVPLLQRVSLRAFPALRFTHAATRSNPRPLYGRRSRLRQFPPDRAAELSARSTSRYGTQRHGQRRGAHQTNSSLRHG